MKIRDSCLGRNDRKISFQPFYGGTILNNEKGVVFIAALIILIVLTLIGLSSIGTSIFETKISGHERFASNAFYAAEGGLDVGINRIPDITAYSGNIGTDETYRSGRITDASPQP